MIHAPPFTPPMHALDLTGAHVIDGRVNGDLALSRALGDFRHKTADLPASFAPPNKMAAKKTAAGFCIKTDFRVHNEAGTDYAQRSEISDTRHQTCQPRSLRILGANND